VALSTSGGDGDRSAVPLFEGAPEAAGGGGCCGCCCEDMAVVWWEEEELKTSRRCAGLRSSISRRPRQLAGAAGRAEVGTADPGRGMQAGCRAGGEPGLLEELQLMEWVDGCGGAAACKVDRYREVGRYPKADGIETLKRMDDKFN
jgi:hypothetical protein